MYIKTEFGFKKVANEKIEIILLDFYGEGLHETLENARQDNEEIDLADFKTEQARVLYY